ncbi:CHAT domain-containing protein [Micromonospora sp. NPDC000729]|uniref:CHAT domain-containing protein n=1 Tax=Micromonospora sp. NPDC000729 TaxID=3364220 RepID=UPI0036CF401B
MSDLPSVAPPTQQQLSLFELLLTELASVLSSEQKTVFGYTLHQLRCGNAAFFGDVERSLRVLAEEAHGHGRPDLWRKALAVLRPDAPVPHYAGPPLTAAQRRVLGSLYDLSVAELADLPLPFLRVRLNLRDGRPVPDEVAVDGLRGLAYEAGDRRRSDLVVPLLRAYLALLPDAWPLWFNLGNHLGYLSKFDEAIAAYDEVLRRNPAHAWSWFNRGYRHDELGHHDRAKADWIEAARLGCDLEHFPDTITRRMIPRHGFTAVALLILDPKLPPNQRRQLTRALRRALDDSRTHDGWYLSQPPGQPRHDARPLVTLLMHAALADIRRDSRPEPNRPVYGRNATGYTTEVPDEDELRRKHWYLVPGGPSGPPDRPAHLDRLEALLRRGKQYDALEALWAVHYVAGAIALSCLMNGVVDWPTPVKRLAVSAEVTPEGPDLDEQELAAVADWVRNEASTDLAGYALRHFRSSADTLRALVLTTEGPDTRLVIDSDVMLRQMARMVADPNAPVDPDDPVTPRLGSTLRAESLWWFVEPVYREWVLAAHYGDRPEARLNALCHARQFNALAATELWSELPTTTWRACRNRILAAYNPDVALKDVQARLGLDTTLIDYYTYEICGETVSQLVVTSGGANATCRDVDLRAGELKAMIQAGQAAAFPATGLSPQVEHPLCLPDALTRTLLFVPYGYLRQIPLHALPTVREALDRGEVQRVVYLSTVSSILQRPSAVPKARRALFVGHDPDEDLGLDDDLANLRRYVDDVTVLTGDAATLDAVLAELPKHDLAHFACHGDIDFRLAAGYLELAGGRLYPWDVMSATTPRTVVINACLGVSVERIETTSDGAFGLHDAFLVAGARHVVGGLWEIPEWTARQFAASLYRHLAEGRDVPAAVADAQRDLRKVTSDPFYWAPHACFGEWRP